MLSWALYSALLKKKKLELSQLSHCLQVIITSGLIFLLTNLYNRNGIKVVNVAIRAIFLSYR